MDPKRAGAPAAHRDARDTAALDGHEKNTATTSACEASSATYRSRAPIPVLEAVRAQPERIRRALEEHTERAESKGCLIWTGARNAAALGHLVCRRSISHLRHGETWSHLTGISRRVRRRAAAGGNR